MLNKPYLCIVFPNGLEMKEFKSIYKCRITSKKVNVRRVDGVDCIVCDIETGEEKRMSQSTMRKMYKYLKGESNPRKWISNTLFIPNEKRKYD